MSARTHTHTLMSRHACTHTQAHTHTHTHTLPHMCVRALTHERVQALARMALPSTRALAPHVRAHVRKCPPSRFPPPCAPDCGLWRSGPPLVPPPPPLHSYARNAMHCACARARAGVVVSRASDGTWSAPCSVAAYGLGWGFQVGGELTDLLLVLRTDEAVSAAPACTRLGMYPTCYLPHMYPCSAQMMQGRALACPLGAAWAGPAARQQGGLCHARPGTVAGVLLGAQSRLLQTRLRPDQAPLRPGMCSASVSPAPIVRPCVFRAWVEGVRPFLWSQLMPRECVCVGVCCFCARAHLQVRAFNGAVHVGLGGNVAVAAGPLGRHADATLMVGLLLLLLLLLPSVCVCVCVCVCVRARLCAH